MHRKRRKTAFTAVFLYLLLTGGLWMFLASYTNSHNRLSAEKITSAELVIGGDKSRLTVAGKKITFGTEIFSPESRLYYVLYLLSPDEIRYISDVYSVCNHVL